MGGLLGTLGEGTNLEEKGRGRVGQWASGSRRSVMKKEGKRYDEVGECIVDIHNS